MFKKTYILTLLLLLTTVGYVAYYCLHRFPKDIKKYEEDLKNNSQKSNRSAQLSAKQNRSHVRKDIWRFNGTQRMHYQITATSSQLTITPEAHRLSAKETLYDLVCLIQESDAEAKVQYIKALYAKEGVYDFAIHQFSANRVLINFHTLPGNLLPDDLSIYPPALQGVAQSVYLTFSKNGPEFHAEKFKANVHDLLLPNHLLF